ncbi:MAG: hypothetical protein ACJ8AG_13835 [Ktedonobacteraceae bacterium]
MDQEQHHAHFPRRRIFRPVSEPMTWALFLWVWAVIWIPIMLLFVWWQVPPFISLLCTFLGIGLLVFILVQYGRARLIPRKDEQGYQTQESDALAEIPPDPQPVPSSSAWNKELFQVPYPEQE